MRVGAFELYEPLPDLKEPHAFAMLSPWVNVGDVGSAAFSVLEAHFDAQDLGRLLRPGVFYDFTRYRPMLYLREGRREVSIPNTYIRHARREQGNDLLFLHCLEPHALGEIYVESVLKVMEKFKVKRYCLIGAMYDSVPHTRPLLITGTASKRETEADLRKANVGRSGYQGPTTINILITEKAPKLGIETLSLIVHLPHYAQFEEDFSGQYSVLSLLSSLYDFSLDLEEIKEKSQKQYGELDLALAKNPQVGEIVRAMEASYDARAAEKEGAEPGTELSPEIERFLREINKELNG